MNYAQLTRDLGLAFSIIANGVLLYEMQKTTRELNSLEYTFRHEVGSIDDTRLGKFHKEIVYAADGKTRIMVPCAEDPKKECTKTHLARNNLAEVAQNLDGRIHALEARLGNGGAYQNGFSLSDARLYGNEHNAMIFRQVVAKWEAESDPDSDGTWNYGANPDQCPTEAGPMYAGVTGCPNQDDDLVGDPFDKCPQTPYSETSDTEGDFAGCSPSQKAWYGTLPTFEKEKYKEGLVVEIPMPDGTVLTCTIKTNADDSAFGDISDCAPPPPPEPTEEPAPTTEGTGQTTDGVPA